MLERKLSEEEQLDKLTDGQWLVGHKGNHKLLEPWIDKFVRCDFVNNIATPASSLPFSHFCIFNLTGGGGGIVVGNTYNDVIDRAVQHIHLVMAQDKLAQGYPPFYTLEYNKEHLS